MTVTAAPCPRCGRQTPVDASHGLCAACLLTSALTSARDVPTYQAVSVIAQDDLAITYLAHPVRPAGPPAYVAVKVLALSVDSDAVLARYEQWRAALSSVRHTGLAPVIDAGLTDAGAVYLVSRYVAGSPLSVMAARTGVDARQRLAIAGQLVDAIEAAHHANLVHLKIRPSSVKVATAARLQVTTLGLGSSLILDDRQGDRESDLVAVADVIAGLGIDLRGRRFADAAAVRAAILRGGLS
jgi:serine/threonine protein kinase